MMSGNSRRQRVMFICSVSPFPKNVGKALMIGGICEFLRDSESVSALKLICLEPVAPGFGVNAEVLPPPGLLGKAVNLLVHSGLRGAKSLQESFYWSRRTLDRIAASIDEFEPDVVIYDTVRTGQFLRRKRGSKIRHVLYMDDLFSVRYERILAASRVDPSVTRDALGNFTASLPAVIVALYDRLAWLRTALLKTETRRISATEMRCPSQFDKCLLISEAEAETLRKLTGAPNIGHIPPRIQTIAPPLRTTWAGDPDFVFLGTLNLSHNAFAIEHFLANGFSSILRLVPRVRLFIVGKGASGNLVRLAGMFAGHVELLGFVENLDVVLARSCAMLAPLSFGSGVKIKAIDALRCGVPLISTPAGVEGMNIAGVAGVKVINDIAEFGPAMLEFLDRERNENASRSNLEAFQRLYGMPVVDVAYRRAFLEG